MASCQLSGDAAVIVETDATAIRLPMKIRARREIEHQPEPDAILDPRVRVDLEALLDHLDTSDPAQRAVRVLDHAPRRRLRALPR